MRKNSLYLFFIAGIFLIILSLFQIYNNYEKQKRLVIANSIRKIDRWEFVVKRNLNAETRALRNIITGISEGPIIRNALINNEDTIVSKNLIKYLKRLNKRIEGLSIYNLKKQRIFIFNNGNIPLEDLEKNRADLDNCVNHNALSDSVSFDENQLITYFISYPVKEKGLTIGYIRLWHKMYFLSWISKLSNYPNEFSLFIFKEKQTKPIYSFYNSTEKTDDSLLLISEYKNVLDAPSVIKNKDFFKIITKTKISLLSSTYNLYMINTPKRVWNHLQDLFDNLVYSILMIIVGVSLLFFVILLSRSKYHRLSKENRMLEKSAAIERRYKELFEKSLLPLAIFQNGLFVKRNKAWLQLLEVDNIEEIGDRNIFDFLHPDETEKIKGFIQEMNNRKKQLLVSQIRFFTTKGVIKTADALIYTTEYNGSPAFLVMINDITESKKYKERFMESESKYSTIFERLNDAVLLIKEDRFVDCNTAAVKMYGFDSKTELLGQHPGKLSPEKQPDGRDSMTKAREMIALAVEKGFNRFDWLHTRKDGSLFWMDVALTSITIDGGKYIYVIGRDISHVKELYHELEKRKDYLYDIIKRLPIPVLVYSDNNEITFINYSFESVFKYKIEDIPTTSQWWESIIDEPVNRKEIKENWDKAVEKMKKDNSVVEQHFEIKTGNGDLRYCEVFAIRIEGEVLMVINDITQVIKLNRDLLIAKEKAQESNMLKSAFLANLSHELRTPMNGILGFSQLLADPNIDSEERESYVDMIQKSGNRLLNMINDIISISKIDASQVNIEINEMDLLPVLDEIVEFFKPEAMNKGLALIFESAGIKENTLVKSDEEKLKQIFVNIIGNAVKYTEEGEIIVRVKIRDNFADVCVSDTGYGIKKENLNKIFDRFIRLEETSQKTDGTGLGLAISKAYAKRLGIEIKVESEFGRGSEFIISIPLAQGAKKTNTTVSQEKENNETVIPDLSGKRILVAEDEELNYMILKLFIESTNAHVVHVPDGLEAVKIMDKEKFDFIFMDIKMPVMNGIEAMQKIKEKYPEVPIVAQTAFTFSEDKDKAMSLGFDDYLSKPLSKDVVINTLRKYFNMQAS